MNREDEFELRLAEWLEDGPFAAPDHVVNAAIEHARGHPRRWFLPPVFGRIVMDGTHAAPAASRHTLHFGRAFAGGMAGVAIVAIVVVGAMLLANRGTINGPAATPKATVSVTSTGTIAETIDEGTASTTAEGIEQLRGIKFKVDSRGSDPRIVGTSIVVLNEDNDSLYSWEYNPGFGAAQAKLWGSVTLTGPKGTWSGAYAGIIEGMLTSYNRHWMTVVLIGTGDYAGLQYRYTQTSMDGTTFEGSGVIEPAPSLPAKTGANMQVTGTDACQKMQLGSGATQKKNGSFTETRNASATCTVKTNDERANGTATRTVNEDLSPDGTFSAWGTSEIVNAGGTWTGVWVVKARAEATAEGFAYIGSGGYAGLRYHGAGMEAGVSYSVDAAIEPAT